MSVTFVYVVFLTNIWLSRCVSSEVFPKCQEADNTTPSCCPCYQEVIENCSRTCPDNYFKVNKSTNSGTCQTGITTTVPTMTDITELTSTRLGVTTDGLNFTPITQSTTSNETDKNEVIGIFTVCMSCPIHQFYKHDEQKCLECDKKCLNCTILSSNCSVCMYKVNDTCLADCPNGTEDSMKIDSDGSKLCKRIEKEGNKILYFIIGGAAGGFVVIVIIIVILCCCCRRRNQHNVIKGGKNQRMAMSVLLENQQTDEESGKDETSKPAVRRPNYENTSQTLPSAKEIIQQGDKVTRYVKDPTLGEKSSENLQKEDEEESPYGNAAMIRLAQNVDTTVKKVEELKEMLDVEELGNAPAAPIQKQSKTPLPVRTKTTGKKGKAVQKAEYVPEDYVDMSGQLGASQQNSGSRVNVEPTSADVRDTDFNSPQLEDYENFSFKDIKQGRKAAKVRPSPEDEMEVYENTAGNQPNKGKGGDSDLEDYENTKDLKKKPMKSKKTKKNTENSDNMEDYENMADLEIYENAHVKST